MVIVNCEDVKGKAWTFVKHNPTNPVFSQEIWLQPVWAIATYLRRLVPIDVTIIEEEFLRFAVR
jgi:hypothetical protein